MNAKSHYVSLSGATIVRDARVYYNGMYRTSKIKQQICEFWSAKCIRQTRRLRVASNATWYTVASCQQISR